MSANQHVYIIITNANSTIIKYALSSEILYRFVDRNGGI